MAAFCCTQACTHQPTGCGVLVQLRPQCIRDQRSHRQPIRASPARVLLVEEGVVSLCAEEGGSAKQAAPLPPSNPPPRPATAGSLSASSEPDGSTPGHFQSTGSPLLTQSEEPRHVICCFLKSLIVPRRTAKNRFTLCFFFYFSNLPQYLMCAYSMHSLMSVF